MRSTLMNLFKIVGTVVLIPAVIAVTYAFEDEAGGLGIIRHLFNVGLLTYVILHLFVFTPQGLYQFIQRIYGELLVFSPAMRRVVPLIVPLGVTLLMSSLYIMNNFVKDEWNEPYFIFGLGFLLAFHVVQTAQEIYDEDDSFLKASYFFEMALVYVINMFVTVVLLDMNFKKFSTVSFYETFLATYKNIVWLVSKVVG